MDKKDHSPNACQATTTYRKVTDMMTFQLSKHQILWYWRFKSYYYDDLKPRNRDTSSNR